MYDPSGYTGTHISAVLKQMEREQSWLARRMGVSPALVQHVISGRRSITRNFVDRACRALDLPEVVLFFGPPELLADTANMTDGKLVGVA